uniref:Uncharacterized protein n=1 Tax=Octopus bimaculoides TaxID=37653 RepID=A0A0L8IH22_OCTBM
MCKHISTYIQTQKRINSRNIHISTRTHATKDICIKQTRVRKLNSNQNIPKQSQRQQHHQQPQRHTNLCSNQSKYIS